MFAQAMRARGVGATSAQRILAATWLFRALPLASAQTSAKPLLLPIDVQALICDGEASGQWGEVGDFWSTSPRPHVITFYRSSPSAVQFHLKIKDSSAFGEVIYDAFLTLPGPGGRRMATIDQGTLFAGE